MAGAVLGSLFVVFVPQYAGEVNQALTGVIYGSALIAVMYLLPGGAAGLLRRLRRLLVDVVEPPAPGPTPRNPDTSDTPPCPTLSEEAPMRSRRAIPLLAALMLLAAACGRDEDAGGGGGGAAADPGITDSSIKIGSSYPFSGPASAYSAIPKALNGYFKKVNEAGGINGRKIEFVTYDDGYEPQRALTNARKLVEQDKVFALFNPLGTANNVAMREYLNQRKVPQLFVATGATLFGSEQAKYPFTGGFQPTYRTEAKVYAQYLKAEKPNAKVAVLYQNDGFGKDLLGALHRGHQGQRRHRDRPRVVRADRPDRRPAGEEAGRVRRRRLPQHQHAQGGRAGDRRGGAERLEAAAHPQQRGRVQGRRCSSPSACSTRRGSSPRRTSRRPRTRSSPTTRR